MKNNFIKSAFVLGVATFVVACSPKQETTAPAPVIDKEAIKQEIQAKENEFAALYNAGEIKNIGYYADDATSYAQNQAPMVGKASIVAYYTAGFDSSSRGNVLSFTTNEVFPSNDANQVIEIGSFKLVDSTSAVINTGNYMVLFEKRDGKYVSVRDMSTSDMPLE
jgi:ketosteroid isomerase-like protein